MIAHLISLRVAGPILLILAFVAGLASASLWLNATQSWQNHLRTAQTAGETLFDALNAGVVLPKGIVTRPVPDVAQSLAQRGDFERLDDVPRPAFVTHIAVNADTGERLSGATLKLAIVSSGLRYPVSELDLSTSQTPRDIMGKVTALLATYCSDAVIFATLDDTKWRRFEGPDLWGCAAEPTDTRLMAGLLGLVSLICLSSLVSTTATQFTEFADQLRARRWLGGADTFKATGPSELQTIIAAVNEYRDLERQHLSERALVLSGVSHDLGTPATRLKLRAELIADPDLRRKFEADIDQMTGIIESVLTYTRAELSTEAPRQLSLTALVDALVADFADTGRPVTFEGSKKITLEGGQSIFMSRRGRSEVQEDVKVILNARPIALQRALSNLIDNALKYGRHAVVSLETDATHAHILIEDEGGHTNLADLDRMKAPFLRGENAQPIAGYGMGLTITSTIALDHGGTLSFEPGKNGVIARLSIARE